MIPVKYHPVTAFALAYVPALSLVIYLGTLATIFASDRAAFGIISSAMNIAPMILVWWATTRAVRGIGAPVVAFTGYHPKSVRAEFRKNLWLWALVLGLAAAATDLTAVVGLSLALDAERQPYSMLRLLLVAAVYMFVAREAIKSCLGPPAALSTEKAGDDPYRSASSPDSAFPDATRRKDYS